jgi:hypothetical protein
MELMDSILVNLKVISKLEPNIKLETDGILFKQVDWSIFPEWARRWWYGQSRTIIINKIKQLYKNSFSIVKNSDKVAKLRILKAVSDSINGLTNLKQTYSEDSTITSQIDVIIEDINCIILQNTEKEESNEKCNEKCNENYEE